MVVQQGRRRDKYRKAANFHPPDPELPIQLFPKWDTLRMLSSRERSSRKGASRRAWAGRVRSLTFSASG